MADRQEEALAKVFTHIKERNDAVSESFCVAKWWHQEMHLAEGINMSCYHCPPHSLEISPDLHNTLHKKRMRYEMLTGRKPEECTRCWDIEDTGEVASPRQVLSMMYLRSDPNIIETTAKIPWNKSVYPKYLEVSFSNKCNLRCTYCAPQKSSALYKEMEKYGDFDLSEENRSRSRNWLQQSPKRARRRSRVAPECFRTLGQRADCLVPSALPCARLVRIMRGMAHAKAKLVP